MIFKTILFFSFTLIIMVGCVDENLNEKNNVKKMDDNQKEVSKSNTFIYTGNYEEWFNLHNDLYFPIVLYDTTKQLLLERTYYLKKKNDWLLLVEVADSLSIVNEFPIIPLLQKLKSKVIDVNKLEIFPSPSIIYKELQIFFEETKEGSKVYNVSFELTNKEKHVVISEEDSLLISKDDLICQFNLNISLHTGEILFYSSDCSNNYIW